MDYLGKHYGFDTYYLDLTKENFKTALPKRNWFCCAIANNDFDNSDNSRIEAFIRTAIDRDILSWHGLGQFGGKLHMAFDMIIVKMEVEENHSEIDVCTIGQDKPNISDSFWGCYGAACLPARTDYDTVKLICVSFDGQDYRAELKYLISRFNEGWLPSDSDEIE
jgi:hypothetical protein